MSAYSPAFQEALEVIRQDPLPENAEQRLEELEKQVTKEEKVKFQDIWSTLFLKSDIPGL